MSATATTTARPPKDGLVRARPGLEVRAAGGDSMPKLTGYMLRFNEPTEIDSIFEGRFIEEIAPGATTKTLRENRTMRVLFNHGFDPSVGEKPLTEPRFAEDEQGVRYDEPELFDADYVRELLPGLRSGQYGSSFKFRVIQEEFNEEPGRSDDNPDGLPVRRITEMKLYEGGPVVFPAYEGASAGVRSTTDRVFFDRLRQNPSRMPEVADLFADWVRSDPERAEELIAEAKEPGEPEPDGDGEGGEPSETEEPSEDTPKQSANEADESDEAAEAESDTALPDGAETSHSDGRSRDQKAPLYGAKPKTPAWRL